MAEDMPEGERSIMSWTDTEVLYALTLESTRAHLSEEAEFPPFDDTQIRWIVLSLFEGELDYAVHDLLVKKARVYLANEEGERRTEALAGELPTTCNWCGAPIREGKRVVKAYYPGQPHGAGEVDIALDGTCQWAPAHDDWNEAVDAALEAEKASPAQGPERERALVLAYVELSLEDTYPLLSERERVVYGRALDELGAWIVAAHPECLATERKRRWEELAGRAQKRVPLRRLLDEPGDASG